MGETTVIIYYVGYFQRNKNSGYLAVPLLIFLMRFLIVTTLINDVNEERKKTPVAAARITLIQSSSRPNDVTNAIADKANNITDKPRTIDHILKVVNKLLENWNTLSLIK